MKAKIFEKIGKAVNVFFDKRTKEELFFAEKFNKFLKMQDYVFCYEMIEQGYKPLKAEIQVLESVMWEKLNNNIYTYDDFKKIKALNPSIKFNALLKTIPIINFNYEQNNENSQVITQLLKSNTNKDKENLIIQEIVEQKDFIINATKDFIKFYKKYYKDGIGESGRFGTYSYSEIEYCRNRLTKYIYLNVLLIKSETFNSEEIKQVKEDFEDFNNYLEKITKPDAKKRSFAVVGKAIIDDFLRPLIINENKEDIDNKEYLLKQLKNYSTRDKSLVEEMNELIIKQQYSLNDLPVQAKEKVENIQHLAKNINTEDTADFVHERIPVILKKYFSIDKEYRTSLKSVEGFNAEELMIQSLDNIERILTAKQQDNNYDLLSELSVESRKLKIHKVV